MNKSLASKRAAKYPNKGSEWFCGFIYTPLIGLGYERGIHRRDPSSILKVNDTYYVWYTKSVGPHFTRSVKDALAKKFPWDYADIWYATSKDGLTWEEKGCAVKRGSNGDYDERTVCTPDCMEYNGKYYLVYQALPQGDYSGYEEFVALSVADSPDGPFAKTKKSILSPMKDGKWLGEEENYNNKKFVGFTHDPMLLHYNNKFYLYYKCTGASRDEMYYAGPDTRWGVAIADDILGPYEHSKYNPVTNSGHETLLWPYNGGIGALINRDGPEKDTIQYAKDGINFEIMSHVSDTPQAGGAYRSDSTNLNPLEGLRWGLCHLDERGSDWNYLVRFDIDTRVLSYRFPHGYPISNCRDIF